MFLDSTSLKNLEIEHTIKDNSFKGSLLWVLDCTSTSMGSRLLRSWLLEPLLNAKGIGERLDATSELFSSLSLRG